MIYWILDTEVFNIPHHPSDEIIAFEVWDHLPTRIPRLLLFHPRTSISANETGMVRTRIGKKVFHTQASYGHEARDEAARQRKKRKTGCAENNTPTTRSLTTPSRALTRQTRSRMEEDESLLATPSKGANLNARRGNKKN